MDRTDNQKVDTGALAFLAGGGEMGDRVRRLDWSQTPLGRAEGWPQSLRSALSICLNASFPIALYWGGDLVLIYNDDWSPIPGEKHPRALGRPAREVWPEIWDTIGPLFEQVITTGQATRRQDQLLPMRRYGYTEECYFDYTFSPVRGEGGGVDGVFNAVVETTRRVVGERRLRTLRELAARTTEEAKSAEDACQSAARFLSENSHDLPFALLYLLSKDGSRATLAGHAGVEPDMPASPATVEVSGRDVPWPFHQVAETGKAVVVADLPERFGPLPGGPWPEPCERAVVLPVSKPGQSQLAGFVVAGASPRLALDDDYTTFMDLLAGHVATAVANARAYEEEKKRAEALAEIDRAKTTFFSNVSHEFRTPLTLMLGPVEDLLARSHTDLPPAAAGQLEVVNRNGLRLLRLVNSLLDFSRIEAGRVRAVYQPTDLAAFTADLASVFRAAVERAGLRLVVDCPKLAEPVYVDREMWEKVVLNLLSNAFKFTFDGEIAVSLRQAGGAAELRVRDTGTGVPAEEMPRLFERFHRAQNARGRTHEGSGIGLALVQELVKLHGGTVTAESVVGEGTAFTVTLPLGSAHLPADQIGDGRSARTTGTGASPYVEEALRWLPDDGAGGDRQELPTYRQSVPAPHRRPEGGDDRPVVLVADDNADMRQYVSRLLDEQFRVVAVPDGEAALLAARDRPPALVLTDVMMPKLDGFGLLKALRADPRTGNVPVIMLSARAGEESRVEGVRAGADDYLVKPFSARELLARVSAHVQMARLRRESERAVRESEERLRMALTAARMVAWEWDPAEDRVVVSDNAADVFGLPPGSTIEASTQGFALVHPDDVARHRATVMEAVEGCGSYQSQFRMVRRDTGAVIWVEERGHGVGDGPGKAVRLVGVVMDITDRKRAEEELRRERDRLGVTLASIGDAVITTDTAGHVTNLNAVAEELTGWSTAEAAGQPLQAVFNIVNEQTRQPVESPATRALREGVVVGLANHTVLIAKDGTERPIDDSAAPIRVDGGEVIGCVLVFRDVTERRRAEEALRASEERFQFVRQTSGVGFWYCDLPFDVLQWDENVKAHFHLPPDAAVTIGTFYDRLHPDDRGPTRAAIERSIRDRVPYDVDYRTVDPATGAERWVRAIGRTFYAPNGTPARFDGVTLDVTDRRRADDALRESELRYRLVGQAANDAIWDWDLVTNTVVWNEGVRRVYGYAEGEVGPDASWWVNNIHPDDRDRIAHDIHAAIDGGTEFWTGEYRYRRADGTYAHVFDRGRVVREGGRPVRMVGSMLDLTERKQLEEELRQVAAELSEADRRKDEFLAVLAHELRNPLAPIRNALQIIKLTDQRGPREEARTLMERQLEQMVRLVDDLMDVSRITRGKLELRRGRVGLAAVVNSAVETSRPLIEQMGHRLAVSLPEQPVVLDADLIRLAQVFANLLTNAAKYTERGGDIRLAAERVGGDVVVSVTDTGIGIPADKLQSIFDMFSQVDRSLEKAQGGLGIGLTLVKRLTEMHGGTVEAKSGGSGKGSAFVVRLPVVAEAPASRRDGGRDETVVPRSSLGILIVDDNRDGADSLAMMLRLLGNDARTAYDGLEGVEEAGRFRPDVILFDIGLPKLNGYEACRRIRGEAWGRNVLLIAVTGWGQDDDRRRSHEAGFDHHMVKPVDPTALMKLLAGRVTGAKA